jgi:dTDP-4-dehydrorhamnose reductase
MNAELSCARFERTFALRLPPWQQGVADCVARLMAG